MNIKLKSLLIVLAGLAGIHQAAAQGTAFSYQGQLQNNGSPANGFYDFQFSLSNAPTGGSQVGSTVTNLNVGVTNGLFSTLLDFGTAFNGNPTWLAISVCSNGLDNYVGLTPLQPITPVPYTMFANTASNVSGTIPTTQLSGALGNSQLANNSIIVIPGTGLGGGGVVPLGGETVLSNTGVLAVTGNVDITASVVGGNVTLGDTATSANTISSLVKRDASGNFSAGTITANLAGNATTATTATNLIGNVSDAQLSDNIALLDGTNAFTGTNNFAGSMIATNANNIIAGTFSGNFVGNITGNAGTATSAASAGIATTAQTAVGFSGSLSGDVTGTQIGTVIAQVGGVSSEVVAQGAIAAFTATSENTANDIVIRDANGNFAAGTIAANLAGNALTATTATNLIGNVSDAQLSGNVALLNGTNAFTGTNNFAGVIVATNVNNVIVGAVIGNAIGLTNLNASQLTTGTVPLALLPGSVLTNDQSGVNLDGLTTVSNLSVDATNYVNYLVVSNAPAFDGSAITNLNASQLTSGTVPVAQLPVATTSSLGLVQPDGSTITVNNGVLTASGNGGFGVTTYITNAMTDEFGQSNAYPHNLGTFPGFIHPILLCTTDDSGTGMVAGQMTEFTSVSSQNFGGDGVFASVSYDTTNIYIQTTQFPSFFYSLFPNENGEITSWDNFAVVVGFHQ